MLTVPASQAGSGSQLGWWAAGRLGYRGGRRRRGNWGWEAQARLSFCWTVGTGSESLPRERGAPFRNPGVDCPCGEPPIPKGLLHPNQAVRGHTEGCGLRGSPLGPVSGRLNPFTTLTSPSSCHCSGRGWFQRQNGLSAEPVNVLLRAETDRLRGN